MPSALSSHVVIFPFMAQGHTLPLLDLSKALSQQQIKVTIITTPSNAKSMAKTISNHPTISLFEIPFPTVDGLPKDCENTSQLPSMEFHFPFLLATKQLRKPFEQTCQGPINLPNHDEMFYQFIQEVAEADAKSWGVVVNSFEELEKSHIPAFESFYINGAKAWCLGPLCLYGKMGSNKSTNQNHSCTSTQWLADQVTPDSVIYVSFGTQADVSDSQLDEVGFALEESGFPFLMGGKIKDMVFTCWPGRESKRQGFDLLESVSAGVPVLAWPMIAEQSLNAKFLVDGLGAGD
ncbi:hypothetical protein OIU84_000079 [Salix udensis]|uniref:Uncharacterized protein n=1 Tax=Salix udensis TaxID=889485 RepID=A0AAD6PLL7_9ROSI|nr:hypothetical protein OIU84_000079 [Salix udensis]